MSETRFTLRRPDPDPAADVESYIDHGTSALPAAPAEPRGGEDPPLVVLLPDSTHRQFKQLAAARGTSMSTSAALDREGDQRQTIDRELQPARIKNPINKRRTPP